MDETDSNRPQREVFTLVLGGTLGGVLLAGLTLVVANYVFSWLGLL